jgi:hypothetical protein
MTEGSRDLSMAVLTRKHERVKSHKGKDFGAGLVNNFSFGQFWGKLSVFSFQETGS